MHLEVIKNIKNTKTFVSYCKNAIEYETNSADEIKKTIGNLINYKISRDIVLTNAIDVIEVYYKFLQKVLDNERYEDATIIKKALDIEIKFFKAVGLSGRIEIAQDIDDINTFYKEKYLDIH
jgi:hypothetical protein